MPSGEHLLGRSARIDKLSMMMDQLLNLTLPLQVSNGNTGERSIDLHTVNQSRLRDHLESRHLLQDSVVSRSVEDDHVLNLQLPKA